MKKFYLLFLLSIGQFAYAQEENGTDHASKYFEEEPIETTEYLPGWGIGLKVGPTGAGLEVARSFSQKADVRIAGNYLKFDREFGLTVSGEPMQISSSIKFTSVEALADWYPFNNSSFRLTGGVAYNFNSTMSGEGRMKKGIRIGEYINIAPEDIGTVGVDIIYNSFAPYAGFGFGRSVPAKKFSFGFEMGVYYFGAPEIKLSATKLLAPTVENEPQLQQNLDEYRWYPLISLRLAYRII